MTTPTLTPTIVVPHDAQRAVCKCGAQHLFWIITAKQKRMQVDCGVPLGKEPKREVTPRERDAFGYAPEEGHGEAGLGVSHFANCPNAADFRKKKS